MQPVRFVDTPVTVADGYECPVCLEHDGEVSDWIGRKGPDYFIKHEGQNGKQHPIHKGCVQPWLINNSSCPTCKVPISNRLASTTTRLTHTISSTAQGASEGTQAIEDPNIFAVAIAITSFSSVIGLWAMRDSLALAGGSYALSSFGGMVGIHMGNGAGARDRIEQMARLTATIGMLPSIPMLISRATQNANWLYAIACFGFAKTAGFRHTGYSATIGAISSLAIQTFLPKSWNRAIDFTKAFTVASGGLGTIVGGFRLDWKLNILPTIAGMRISASLYDCLEGTDYAKYSPLIASVAGSMTSGITSSIFTKAQEKRQLEQQTGPYRA